MVLKAVVVYFSNVLLKNIWIHVVLLVSGVPEPYKVGGPNFCEKFNVLYGGILATYISEQHPI